jgi:hypothetical protein
MNYASMMGMFGGMGNVFSGTPKVKLYSVLSITPGKRHAWIDSSEGRIRKPINSIPKDLMDEFKKGVA